MAFNVRQIFTALNIDKLQQIYDAGQGAHDERRDFSFEDAERAQLLAWVDLSASAKIDFFEEMVELAYLSGALAPDRLAMRDAPSR